MPQRRRRRPTRHGARDHGPRVPIRSYSSISSAGARALASSPPLEGVVGEGDASRDAG